VHKICYNILKNYLGPFLQLIFGRCLTKKAIFGAKKMKNELFMPRKGKYPKSTLFLIQRYTHVYNMRSFEQTMPWLWPYLAHMA
jgi:hypothetical protein